MTIVASRPERRRGTFLQRPSRMAYDSPVVAVDNEAQEPLSNAQMNLSTRILTVVAAAALSVGVGGCASTASVNTASTVKDATGTTGTGPISADRMRELDAGTKEVLERLYVSTPGSRELVAKGRAVLVFPKVYAAGFVIGGEYGEGELRSGGTVAGYYRTTTGSIGWQIGAQSRALVFVFMTQDALDKFRAGNGWAGGVDASVAVAKVGANGMVDVNAAQAPTTAFVMTNAGLMASATLEGTKITRIQ